MAYAAEKARYLLGLFGTTTIGQERPIVLIAKVLEDLPASLGCQAPHQRETDDTKKNESINEIGRLLRESRYI